MNATMVDEKHLRVRIAPGHPLPTKKTLKHFCLHGNKSNIEKIVYYIYEKDRKIASLESCNNRDSFISSYQFVNRRFKRMSLRVEIKTNSNIIYLGEGKLVDGPSEIIVKDIKKALILFIHGFDSEKEIWQKYVSKFPEDVRENYDVEYLEYTTKKIPYMTLKFKLPNIGTLGDSVGSAITAYGKKYHNIVLICHSLGGLVAADCLTSSAPSSVSKILLYAVPCNGSKLANIASWIMYFKKNIQIWQMKVNSKYLVDLQSKLLSKGILRNIKCMYFVGDKDGIVDGKMAHMHWEIPKEHFHVAMKRDHSTIIVPTEPIEKDITFGIAMDYLLGK